MSAATAGGGMPGAQSRPWWTPLPASSSAGFLLPVVPPSPASRIMNVSSGAQTTTDFEDPVLGERYSENRACVRRSDRPS